MPNSLILGFLNESQPPKHNITRIRSDNYQFETN